MILLTQSYKLDNVCNADIWPLTDSKICMSIQDTHKNQLQAKFNTIYCNSQYFNLIYSVYFFPTKHISQEIPKIFKNFFFIMQKNTPPRLFLYVIRSNYETQKMFLMFSVHWKFHNIDQELYRCRRTVCDDPWAYPLPNCRIAAPENTRRTPPAQEKTWNTMQKTITNLLIAVEKC